MIPKDVAEAFGGKEGPIRLLNGDAKNGGVHIEKRHGEEIRGKGFRDAAEFVDYISKKYDAIFEGKGRSFFLTVRGGKSWPSAVMKMEYDSNGDFWKIQTASFRRSGHFLASDGFEKRKLLWERAQTNHLDNKAPNAISGQSSSVADKSATDKISRASEESKVSASSVRSKIAQSPFSGVKVLDTPRDLPPGGLRDYVLSAGGENVKGFYDRQTERAYVFTGNHADAADVFNSILHESFHDGFSALRDKTAGFGRDVGMAASGVSKALDQIWTARAKTIRGDLAAPGKAYEGMFDLSTPSGRRALTEEWLAHKAGEGAFDNPSGSRWYDRYVAAVTQWARAVAKHLGFDVKWTGAETLLALTTEITTWTAQVHKAAVTSKIAVRSAATLAGVAAAEASVSWPA